MSLPSSPQDPEYTSEPNVLSPVSPKPLHVPIPSKIPVLQNQIDPAFNQTDAHMATPDQPTDPAELPESIQGGAGAQDEQVVTTDEQGSGINAEDGAGQVSLDPSAIAERPSDSSIAASNGVPEFTDAEPVSQGQAAATSAGVVPADYQALVNSLISNNPPASLDPAASFIPLDDTSESQAAPGSNLGQPSGLPPRPPPQTQASVHSDFAQTSDILQYHPPALAPPGSAAHSGANGLPPPPVPSFQQPTSSAQSLPNPPSKPNNATGARDGKQGVDNIVFDNEEKWSPEIQRKYEGFLESERHFVTEGNWEQFPNGSRLFVGNLSSERVTKRDVFHVFHKYGKLAQISIKQAYGFVQFLLADDCRRALDAEQGQVIRGKRINLEISKPQKNRAGVPVTKRRSKSPERKQGNVDRYTSGGRRGRDDYRPARSPSPRGYRERSRDRYGRHRSRSRSPYGRGGRQRSPSSRRDEDDDLPLPRRQPRDVPDVQIIVADNLDRGFVQWVEKGIAARGIKVDVLLLSPRLSEAAVIKRQIIEGVTAVSRLTRNNQQIGKIPLQLFDRRGGSDVRFEEYADLDPDMAAQVVLRAKTQNLPTYGYGYGSQNGSAPPNAFQPAAQPQNANPPASMGPAELTKLLGSIQQPGGQVPANVMALLNGMQPNGQQGAYGQAPPQAPAHNSYDGRGNDALANLLAGVQSSTPMQQGNQAQGPAAVQHNITDIMAKLGSYQRQ